VLYRLLVLTGRRRGEAVGPRWSALDLLNGTLTVHRQVVHVAGALIEGPPKSEPGRRTVGLDRGTVDLLRALGASSPAIGLAPISPSATSQPQNRCSPLCRVRTVDSS
jgi:integrase